MASLVLVAACLTGTHALTDADMTFGPAGGRFGWRVQGGIQGSAAHVDSLAVSAPFDSTVYIFNGLTAGVTPATAAATFVGGHGDEAGWALARGRLIGTTRADLVIAAPSADGGRGEIYVLENGTMTGSMTPADAAVTLHGNSGGDFAGWDVDTGDFDGDGDLDILVGVCGFNHERGAAVVVFGPFAVGDDRNLWDPANNLILRGEPGASDFGCTVASGDIDGNGRDEVIVGAPAYTDASVPLNGGMGASGRVYALFSRPAPGNYVITDSTLNVRMWTGDAAGESLGDALSSGYDYNDDGYDDLLLGASGFWCDLAADHFPGSACSTPVYGAAHMILGRPRTAGNRVTFTSGYIGSIADVTMESSVPGIGFGTMTEFVGDMNGDGYSEVAVGSRTGEKVWVSYGTTVTGAPVTVSEAAANLVIDGAAEGLFLGLSASSVDANHDGLRDILVGAGGTEWTEDGAPTVDGGAWVFQGEI